MESKPSTIAKNKYNAKAYDRIAVQVTKGARDALHAVAVEKGYAGLNTYIIALLEADSGLQLTKKSAGD